MSASKKTHSRDSSSSSAKWRLFDQTVNEVREAFASTPADELQNSIDEAFAHVRRQKRRKRKVRTDK